MSKQVDPKKPVDPKAKAVQPKPAQAPAQAKAPVVDAKAAKKPETPALAQVPKKATPAAPVKAAPLPVKGAQAAPAQAAAPQKSALHTDIDKIVVDATKNFEHKKTSKTEIVHEVKEVKITGDDKKSYTALVVYLPFVYVKNHKALLAKIVNDIQSKKKLPAFIVSQRTLINKKSDFKQKIPRNRTLTAVYDSILEDLINPGTIIGKRQRYHLDGSQHTKIFLNDDSKNFLESKINLIAQIYFKLTNRKVTFEFRPEISYIRVPLIKAPRAKAPKRGTAGPKKESAQASQ
jgi:small subunit ribosomal protein S7e